MRLVADRIATRRKRSSVRGCRRFCSSSGRAGPGARLGGPGRPLRRTRAVGPQTREPTCSWRSHAPPIIRRSTPGTPTLPPRASRELGMLRASRATRRPGARPTSARSTPGTPTPLRRRRTTSDSGHADHAPLATGRLGVVLERQGNYPAARDAFQRALDSGHAEHALRAAARLGLQLERQGDLAGACVLYRRALDFGSDKGSVAKMRSGPQSWEKGTQCALSRVSSRSSARRGRSSASGHTEMFPSRQPPSACRMSSSIIRR